MTDKLRTSARIEIKLRLHREQAQHAVDLMHDFAHAFPPPRPHRRTDIMQGRNARPFQLFRHTQIKIGRIDTDKHIGLQSQQILYQPPAYP